MKTLTTYIIRHGEAMCNLTFNEVGDTSKSVLTQKGVYQSQMTGRWLRSQNVPLQSIYSSSMTRAIQTAELLETQLPISRNSLLDERIMGNLVRKIEGGKPLSIIKQFCLTSSDYLFWQGAEGESQHKVFERVIEFLIQTECNIKNSAIISHGHVIDALRAIFLGIVNPDDYFKFISLEGNHVRHCQIYKVTLNADTFNLIKEDSYFISERNIWTKLEI